MWLILQIALGILFGFILIQYRYQILSIITELAAAVLFLIAIIVVFYISDNAIGALDNYVDTARIGQSILFVFWLITFLPLMYSALFGITLLLCFLVPAKFIELCERNGKPLWPALILLMLATIILISSQDITLPAILSNWQAAWKDWWLARGMGGNGGPLIGLLLWQLIWIPFVLLFRLRGTPRMFAPPRALKPD